MMNNLLDHLPDGFHRLRLDDGRPAIAKLRRRAPAGFFAAEARGLEALAGTKTLRVPDVFAIGERGILIEDLGAGRAGRADWERAGTDLARLHGHASDTFGFDSDGWCGDSPQDNTRCADGHVFFAEHRLRPQTLRARASGELDAGDVARIERMCAQLPHLVPAMPPVLIHGDLWTANLHACASGELALIDAGAVHYGWAEADLAMLTLFGEPPASFFAAYEAASGVDPAWRGRAPLYNLYHLLNHLNLFGASYLGGVHAVLRRYG
ncbi:MAG TPA: fructosamine kinase family protein [Rhodanobacteraceae bacterium]|nr:fructosamine kinase family protein [Rhodanobacteraceae bacterium]